MIRFGQSMGLSLKDIASVNDEMQTEGLSRERAVELMDEQLEIMKRKTQDGIGRMRSGGLFVRILRLSWRSPAS